MMFECGSPGTRGGKNGFHQLGQFLDTAQRAESQSLHLVLGLTELPRDLPFDVRPDLLVGIQLRRVRRQREELELAVLGRDEVLDQLGLVDRVAIDDQNKRGRNKRGQAHLLRLSLRLSQNSRLKASQIPGLCSR